MKNLFLVALLCLAVNICQAQITVKQLTVVDRPEKSQTIGNFVEVPKDFKAIPFNIGFVEWKTEVPPDDLTITLTDATRAHVPFIPQVNANKELTGFVVKQVGHFWVRVKGSHVDFEKKIFSTIDDEIDFFVDKLETKPDVPFPPIPPPKPDIPADSFDNIGQRVAEWSKVLPQNKIVGQIYLDAAKSLRSDKTATTDSVTVKIGADLRNKLVDPQIYSALIKQVSLDLGQRWDRAPLSKGVLADFYACVALGLGVKE
jgi:hypothetical protein